MVRSSFQRSKTLMAIQSQKSLGSLAVLPPSDSDDGSFTKKKRSNSGLSLSLAPSAALAAFHATRKGSKAGSDAGGARSLRSNATKVGPGEIGLPEYSRSLQDEETDHEELLRSYPIAPSSPWFDEHVEVLSQFIGNFREYAMRSRRTHAFDLMICAICCGSTDLAKNMWKHCNSPLRAALLAQDFVKQVRKRRLHMDDLDVLSTFFQDAAQGVLEGLPTDARSKVLIAVPKAAGRGGGAESNWHGVELLGTPLKHTSLEWLRKVFCSRYVREAESPELQPPSHHPKSILDVAIELQNKEFVAHPYCQNVLDDFWCGRSAKCGKVALHYTPSAKESAYRIPGPYPAAHLADTPND